MARCHILELLPLVLVVLPLSLVLVPLQLLVTSGTRCLTLGSLARKVASLTASKRAPKAQALKKLKDLKLDRVHDEPDAKVVTLIRTQLSVLIKGNLSTICGH